jgi:hypothetical protein
MDSNKLNSAPVIVAIAVLAVGIIGFFGYKTVAGQSTPQVTKAVDARKSIEQLARQSEGDYSKLTPEEQKLLDVTYRGNGQRALRNVYKTLTASGGH